MGNFTYLMETANYAKTATITASTADSAYPIGNLSALPVSKPFRFLGKTSESLSIDLGTFSQSIDLVALLNTNLDANGTITLN